VRGIMQEGAPPRPSVVLPCVAPRSPAVLFFCPKPKTNSKCIAQTIYLLSNQPLTSFHIFSKCSSFSHAFVYLQKNENVKNENVKN
jgi:hypothetical protein